MSRVFSRPLFQANFVKRYAEGGIVSTIAPEYESPEEAPPPDQDPMKILSDVAMQVDTTEKNLDAAGSIDEILSSFAGSPKTADDARNELADLVGRRDAMATPESVLALVQPTMAILEMSRSMSPPGGIANAPLADMVPPDAAPPMGGGMGGTAPVNFTPSPDGMPVPGFATGGDVDLNAIMQKYQTMNAAVPQNYGTDPASAWLALAQVGAGMAQGRSFAQGLSRGTEMAGPYMQAAIEQRNKRRDALSNYVAAEALRQETQAAEESRLAQTLRAQRETAQMNIRAENARLDRTIAAQQELEALRSANDLKIKQYEVENREMPDTVQTLDKYNKMKTLYDELPDDDPNKRTLGTQIDSYEKVLFSKTDNRTPEERNAARLAEIDAALQARPGDPTLVAEKGYLLDQVKGKTTTPKLQGKNVILFDAAAPNGFRSVSANYDSTEGVWFTKDPKTGERVDLDPNNIMEGTADDVLQITTDDVGNTKVTIKQGPRTGDSYLTTFTNSDGEKIKFNNPPGVGVSPTNPYAIKREAPTVPVEKLSPQTRDDMATKLSGLEQSINNVEKLLNSNLQTGPYATMEGWMTDAAAFPNDELARKMEFLKTEQGAAQWALVQREIVRARVLSPRFAVSEQEAVREFETQAGPQEFATNPKAAAVRLGEILRSMKNDYEYLKGQLTNSPYYEMESPTLGTPDDPFDMSDERDNAYFNQIKSRPEAVKGLKDSVLFFPNFPAGYEQLGQKFSKTNGARGVGYYITVGDLYGN